MSKPILRAVFVEPLLPPLTRIVAWLTCAIDAFDQAMRFNRGPLWAAVTWTVFAVSAWAIFFVALLLMVGTMIGARE